MDEEEQATCPICYEDLFQKGLAFYGGTCGHSYHVKCLNASVAAGNMSSCPMCRCDWETDAVVVRPVPELNSVINEQYATIAAQHELLVARNQVRIQLNESRLAQLEEAIASDEARMRERAPEPVANAVDKTFDKIYRHVCTVLSALEVINVGGAAACLYRAAPAERLALALSMIYVVDNVVMVYERSRQCRHKMSECLRQDLHEQNRVLSLWSKVALDLVGSAFVWFERDMFVRISMFHATRVSGLVVYYAWSFGVEKDNRRMGYLISTLIALLPMLWAVWTKNMTLAVCAVSTLGLVEAEKAIRKAAVPRHVMYALFTAHMAAQFTTAFAYVASTLRHMS